MTLTKMIRSVFWCTGVVSRSDTSIIVSFTDTVGPRLQMGLAVDAYAVSDTARARVVFGPRSVGSYSTLGFGLGQITPFTDRYYISVYRYDSGQYFRLWVNSEGHAFG